MSFNISTGSQFTSELINVLKPKANFLNQLQLPGGLNYGDYLYWNGNSYVVGDQQIKLGSSAGQTNQGEVAVAIGIDAGSNNQGPGCVAVGPSAGQFNQGSGGSGPTGCCSVAVGVSAGQTNQGFYSVAIGPGAGSYNQTPGSIALGFLAGEFRQGGGTGPTGPSMNCCAIAIGVEAGQNNQGMSAIAIGNGAGQDSQAANSIVINATNGSLDNTDEGTCKIAPLRDTIPENTSFVMSYSPSTSELTYNSNPQILRSFGQGNELLLSDFNTVHYYTYSGSPAQSFDISTNMAENAVYEVTFNLSGSSASNNDMAFYPNYTGGGSLYTNYIQRLNSGDYQGNSATGTGFGFDLVDGSNGYDPIGKFTIFNNRNAKKIRADMGDTFANSTGSGYWLTAPPTGTLSYNTATQWLTVGRISVSPGSFTNVAVTVKRVA